MNVTQQQIDACWRRAVELVYVEQTDKTCKELRSDLAREFPQRVIDATMAWARGEIATDRNG